MLYYVDSGIFGLLYNGFNAFRLLEQVRHTHLRFNKRHYDSFHTTKREGEMITNSRIKIPCSPSIGLIAKSTSPTGKTRLRLIVTQIPRGQSPRTCQRPFKADHALYPTPMIYPASAIRTHGLYLQCLRRSLQDTSHDAARLICPSSGIFRQFPSFGLPNCIRNVRFQLQQTTAVNQTGRSE